MSQTECVTCGHPNLRRVHAEWCKDVKAYNETAES